MVGIAYAYVSFKFKKLDFAKLLERNGFTVKLFADDVKVYLKVVELSLIHI